MDRSDPVFRFRPFEVQTGSRELRKHGTRVKLRGQPYLVLEILLERAGQVVSRDELRAKLWTSDTFVDFEHALNTTIKKVRQALCDSAVEPRYVETLPKIGYRFIAPVEIVDAPPAPSSHRDPSSAEKSISQQSVVHDPVPTATAAPLHVEDEKPTRRRSASWTVGLAAAVCAAAILFVLLAPSRALRFLPERWKTGMASVPKTYNSLAVLPLQSLSDDPGQDYFADGITDELITNFAQFGNLRVISRTSAMRYKGAGKSAPQIGKELGVDALVEGTVERTGNHVRVRVQLIDTSSDRHLWARSYDRELSDVLMLESSVAHDIAEEVQGHIASLAPANAASPRVVNPQAYEAYLKGRYFWNKRSSQGLTKSIEFFEQAISLDPKLAVAYAGLAGAYSLLGSDVLPVAVAQGKARVAARKAIELDASLAEGHAALALIEFYYDWDWKSAEREFQLALRLNPNYATAHQWYSYYLGAMGRAPEAMQEARRAQELDPLSLSINGTLAGEYIAAHQYGQAIAIDQKTLEMDPGFVPAHLSLGLVYEELAMWPQAIDEVQKAADLSQNSATSRAALARAFALSGKRAEARRILKSLEGLATQNYVSSFELAKVCVAIDDHATAVRYLEKAYREHESQLPFLRVTKALEPLHSDPRFSELLQRMRLPVA